MKKNQVLQTKFKEGCTFWYNYRKMLNSTQAIHKYLKKLTL
jgi:hypothetical protein